MQKSVNQIFLTPEFSTRESRIRIKQSIFQLPYYNFTTPSKAFVQTVIQQIPEYYKIPQKTKQLRQFTYRVKNTSKCNSYLDSQFEKQPEKVPLKTYIFRSVPSEPRQINDQLGLFSDFQSQFEYYRKFKQPRQRIFLKEFSQKFILLKSKLKVDVTNKEFNLSNKRLSPQRNSTIFRGVEELYERQIIQNEIERISKIQFQLNMEKFGVSYGTK
ncbi:hypothetical protein SS50377_26532 [Spironucleus salmonicida]|uniref:Uncharacterized protein n=1 Tax=Spironucleus salmonicida TaxID=348837 RepID=V6LAB6_9EUKA|nr:hypothetical protein SS50377_26532 [Spironucleus salmonicida]|eukprot:EST41385.1 Hypothetical protein SS50377_19101 [Spironucleus salmonicida]